MIMKAAAIRDATRLPVIAIPKLRRLTTAIRTAAKTRSKRTEKNIPFPYSLYNLRERAQSPLEFLLSKQK